MTKDSRRSRLTSAPRRQTAIKDIKPTLAEVIEALSQLNNRDKELVAWLYEVYTATTDQLRYAFFNTPGGNPAKEMRDCWRRLWELGKMGVIANLPLDQRRRAWLLDVKGVMAAESLLRIPSEERLSVVERAAESMHRKHHLTVAGISCELRKSGIPHTWMRRRLRLSQGQDRNRLGLFLYPDATVTYAVGFRQNGVWRRTGTRTVYIEVDMDTEDIDVIRRKVERYLEAMKLAQTLPDGPRPSGVAPDSDCYLVFLCTSARRPVAERVREIQAVIDEVTATRYGEPFTSRQLLGLAAEVDQAGEAIFQVRRLTGEYYERLAQSR